MELKVEPGKYIIAVSGGVDSVVLLELLSKLQGLDLVVAHFDHGIRGDSAEDRVFVQKLSKQYGFVFDYATGELGENASEALARTARYNFLFRVKDKHQATAIITAHHQDDLLETMIINILRGTGRRGLSSLQSRSGMLRPLLSVSKSEILEYAHKNKLKWQEDPTNTDTKYLRNRIRLQILLKMLLTQRASLLDIQKRMLLLNQEIDYILSRLVEADGSINRYRFTMLPHNIARELVAYWLSNQGVSNLNRRQIELIVVGLKTLSVGKKIDVDKTTQILIGKTYAKII